MSKLIKRVMTPDEVKAYRLKNPPITPEEMEQAIKARTTQELEQAIKNGYKPAIEALAKLKSR